MPTASEIIQIIEAIGDQAVRLEWAQNLSGVCIFAIVWFILTTTLGLVFWIAHRMRAFK